MNKTWGRGREFMYLQNKDGTVYLLNNRGEIVSTFLPIKFRLLCGIIIKRLRKLRCTFNISTLNYDLTSEQCTFNISTLN